ncbi:penicillin-binding transpeptidase domain-containing protein [Inediibacterium massiliense]|uniref:penicillin-binding transpeptidase domain-containing protein n=1 Tax=Inediibacterium massiliense TaxID=1658111 RepID=UPI0006B5D54D|nr:penicillin-binding transpeptidase domain-containing protein [Inediibacterium massiliense]
MIEKLKDRHNQVILFFTIFIFILIIRLFTLTVVQGEKYKKMAENIRIKKIPISAPRGDIRDRYGRLLATSEPSFTVQIMKNELIDEKINKVAIKLLNIFIENSEKYQDNFPIILENGKFSYTFDKEIQEWLTSQGLTGVKDAKDAFSLLRQQLGINKNLNDYEAQTEMQTSHNVYPPISVKTMKFIPEMKKENFLQKYNLKENMNAKDAFVALKEKFKIKDEYSDEDVRKILVIRHELKEQGYRQYQPVKIALNVSAKTVSTIEESSMDLPGVNVEVDPIRYYPNGNLASHILGYLGKISDQEQKTFTAAKGYTPNSLIGKDGLERVYEEKLKGKDGAKYVEVDVIGRLVNVLREQKPQKGETLYLSIDAKLQKIAEDALEHALKQIQVGGSFKSEWGDYKYSAFPNATSGAVVALDVNTGEVLALANYPSFDPNLFATGISSEAWKLVQDENPRDPLSPLPLYNVATKTAVQPGSIFKMMTGLAAIEQGLDPHLQLYDDGYIKLGGRSFGCWLWNGYHRKHGPVDLYKALEVSCNYYFYNVSTGWDHYKNKSLGINMGADKILEYAKMFGLGQSTGIEISESAYGLPNPQQKLANTKILLKRDVASHARKYFEETILKDEKKLEEQIQKIVDWTDENPSRGELIHRIGKLDVKKDQVEPLADLAKFNYYIQAKWTKGDTFNLAIGQGQHAYTPLQIANYIATLSNGGYKNEVHLVNKVGSSETDEKIEHKREKVPLKDSENLKHVKIGMDRVTQEEQGTGSKTFLRFPIKVSAKTGTAEKSGKIQPKDEVAYLEKYMGRIAPGISRSAIQQKTKEYMKTYKNEGMAMRKAIKDLSNGRITDAVLDQYKPDYDNFAWFVSYAPSDHPQIAVVSLIFQGGHGGYASPIAREIIAEYFGLNSEEYDKIQLGNTLTN